MWEDPASRNLIAALRVLRARAGAPSLRTITALAAEHGLAMSHTTVACLFNGTAIPSWDHVAAVVTALDAQPDTVRGLWEQAQVERMKTAADRGGGFEYFQRACPQSAVAAAYTEHGAHGWEPLHLFACPDDPRAVQLVMRRPTP